MVLIDTSVWISLYRQGDSPLGLRFQELVLADQACLCAQVVAEFLRGFRKKSDFGHFRERLRLLPFLETDLASAELAAQLLAEDRSTAIGDALIAATAIRHKAQLMTLDADFRRYRRFGLTLLEP